jgi:dienelactone hydrolase
MRRTTALIPTACLLAACLLTACGSAAHHPAAQPTPVPGPSRSAAAAPRKTADTYGCLTPDQAAAGSYALPTENGSLDAYLRDPGADPGKVALVLSHQAGGSLCDWLPHLADFAGAGYTVLAYTSGGDPDELKLVLHYLAGRGTTAVALVGASKGANASLVEAADPAPPVKVAAVVSLSAPLEYQGRDADRAVAAGPLPRFLAAAAGDSPFDDAARKLHDDAAGPANPLKLYPGGRHGALLLDDGALPDVLAFLAEYAPPHA